MGFIQHSGSEVMGTLAAEYRLTPTDDSLKTVYAGPSSSQPFSVLTTQYHVCRKMSNVFLPKN